jgi:hypothetical protein
MSPSANSLGWISFCSVDGHPSRIVRANVALCECLCRRERVTSYSNTRSVPTGLIVSGAALATRLLVALFSVVAMRGRLRVAA